MRPRSTHARARTRVARIGTVALFGVAIVAVGMTAHALIDTVQREFHERLPASTWRVVELVEPATPGVAEGEPLGYRIRALRHRTYTERRTGVLSCAARSGMFATIWRQVGPTQYQPAQVVGPAVIGYAEDEPVPQSLASAERAPGLEIWPGPMPSGPHDCALAFRWPITTSAGAEHIVTASSRTFPVNVPPPLEAESVVAPAPPAAELLDQVDEPASPTAPSTIEDTIVPRAVVAADEVAEGMVDD